MVSNIRARYLSKGDQVIFTDAVLTDRQRTALTAHEATVFTVIEARKDANGVCLKLANFVGIISFRTFNPNAMIAVEA